MLSVVHSEPVQREIDQLCTNFHCVIVTERIILKLYMQIDYTMTYANVNLALLYLD